MSTDLQHHVVSIVGMPGLGKTTLAKKVFRSVQDIFQCSAWVFVSQKPTIKDLLQDIARQVGLVERERNEDVEANLFNFLREKRYVIVIDDIWHTQTWDALSIGIPINSGNGSRIIVTSRLRNVGTYIGGQYSLHELLPLDQEKSKELFFKMVMVRPQTSNVTSDPSKLENVGLLILDRCGGVPLAIVVTTSLWLLSERMEQAWREVLNSMGRNHDEISKTLALSYGDLPTDLKPCFLYFGLFPEDHEISAVDLINLRVAEGFIKARGKQETLYVKLPRDNLMPCWLHKFTNLRKLRIRAHEDIADQVTKVLSNATPVSQKLENLRFKWNVFSRKTLAVNLNLSRYLHVCKLQLIGRIMNLPKPDELPPNLTKLTLRHINLEEDPFETLRKLPKLRILKLSTIGDMRMMVCCGGSSADNFPQLQVLEIEYLYHLEELIVEEGGMPRLNKLSIRNCPKLRPLSDNLKNITMLSS
ncbi:hypothetical protein F0562_029990 [Nyssa sinensis]|uniref:Uncharacterized protein n=1 Tax=Nyssa sinensis TaxID=561372 RepID=A0A5J5AZR0_9ASTE|nr:hypothetical protein F0562_029990 [Nyssa sinensis]